MKHCLRLIILFFISHNLAAQVVISGYIKDTDNTPVPGIFITLSKTKEASVAAFTNSNHDGFFKIDSKLDADSIFITAKHMSFKTVSKKIKNETQTINFTIEYETTALDDIVIKAPVSKKGDTISYSVDALIKFDDRSLADVMKRIPGLEVTKGGNVLYHGDPIEKFYIEGLDMMGGRYGIINNNLPADRVNTVEILEKHQSIRMLEKVVSTDRTSLNIKLKNKYTAVVPLDVGLGASSIPLYSLRANPMVFSPKHHFSGNFLVDNTGQNGGLTVRTFGVQVANLTGGNLVDIKNPIPPPFAFDRWRKNNTLFGSLNYLKKLNERYTFKVNVSAVADKEKQTGGSETIYTFPNQTQFSINEIIQSEKKMQPLSAEINISENSGTNYFNNKLKASYEANQNSGFVIRNEEKINQIARVPKKELTNDFSTMKKWGNKIYDFKSAIEFTEQPQSLTFQPVGFNLGFAEAHQQAVKQTGKINMSVGTYHLFKSFTLNNNLLIQYDNQSFESELSDKSRSELIEKAFLNHLHFKKGTINFNNSAEKQLGRWFLKLQLPLQYQSLKINDEVHNENRDKNLVFIEPKFNLKYKLSNFWEFSLNSNKSRSLGNISSLYFGYFMPNYTTLNIRDTPLPDNSTWLNSLNIQYNNPFIGLTTQVYGSLANMNRNIMTESEIKEDGSSIIKGHEEQNASKSNNLSARIHYNVPKTSLQLRNTWTMMNSNRWMMVNGNRSLLTSRNINNSTTINYYPISDLSIGANMQLMFFKSHYENSPAFGTNNSNFKLDLKYRLLKKHTLQAIFDHYQTTQQSSRFLDLNYRFSLHDKKIDFDLSISNVLNNKTYYSSNVNSFDTRFQYFELRPLEVLLKVKWVMSPMK